MSDYEAILKAYELSGGNPRALQFPDVGSLVVKENKVLSSNEVEGLFLKSEETSKGVKAKLLVKKGCQIRNPVHLCFGVIPEEGIQEIIMDILLEDNSSVELLAHCTFPNAVKVKHIMTAKIKIGRVSSLKYSEVHYHGLKGGIEVIPKAEVDIAPQGRFHNNFTLIQGRVGKLNIDYNVKVAEKGVVELIAKVYGKEKDEIKIKESVFLNGEEAKGLTKSRVVVIDKAKSEVIGETYGNAPGARGHVDCVEIIEGEAQAEAIPKVSVSNSEAKVTHEAAIGRVDKKQIETLMARGLGEAEAIDVVIGGMLK